MEGLPGAYEFESRFNQKYSVAARRIIRILSENSRASVSEISNYADVSRRTARRKLLRIEKELGVRYTLEFDEQRLGAANPHLIALKFQKRPNLLEIAKLFESSYIPQVVVSTKGDYDMFVYANSGTSGEYIHWDRGMRILLSKYGVTWRVSQVVHRQLGFFPLRNELLDRLGIPEKYREMLKLLNGDSRLSFQSMSRTLRMHFNTVAYNFSKLKETGYIKRFTATLEPIKEAVFLTFFSTYRMGEGYEEGSAITRRVFMADDRDPLISRYLMCSPLIGSYDFFTIGAFDDLKTAVRKDVMLHRQILRNYDTRIAYAYVDRVLLGRLPIRSLDSRKVYDTIKWTTEMAPAQK